MKHLILLEDGKIKKIYKNIKLPQLIKATEGFEIDSKLLKKGNLLNFYKKRTKLKFVLMFQDEERLYDKYKKL